MNRLPKITTQVAAAVLGWGFVFAAAQPSFAHDQAGFAPDKTVETWVSSQEQALMEKLNTHLGMPVSQAAAPRRHTRVRVRLVPVRYFAPAAR